MTEQHSKYPEVAVTNTASAFNLIHTFNSEFPQYGLPMSTVSDNEPLFTYQEQKTFFAKHSTKHCRIIPFWLQPNGGDEIFRQTLIEVICTICIEKNDWVNVLHKFILVYQLTPHSLTSVLPADVLFQQEIRHFLPDPSKIINSNKIQKMFTDRKWTYDKQK